MRKRLRWQWRQPQSTSWRVDETYIKTGGRWAYLYRAVDKHGNTDDQGLRSDASAQKGQARAFNMTRDIRGEARIVERAFGLGASVLTEAVHNKRLELEAA